MWQLEGLICDTVSWFELLCFVQLAMWNGHDLTFSEVCRI